MNNKDQRQTKTYDSKRPTNDMNDMITRLDKIVLSSSEIAPLSGESTHMTWTQPKNSERKPKLASEEDYAS